MLFETVTTSLITKIAEQRDAIVMITLQKHDRISMI